MCVAKTAINLFIATCHIFCNSFVLFFADALVLNEAENYGEVYEQEEIEEEEEDDDDDDDDDEESSSSAKSEQVNKDSGYHDPRHNVADDRFREILSENVTNGNVFFPLCLKNSSNYSPQSKWTRNRSANLYQRVDFT